MNCNEVRELIPAYLDNEISPSEKRLIQSHLAICRDCMEEVEAMDRLTSDLQEHFKMKVATVALSAAAWSNVQAALPVKPGARSRLRSRLIFPTGLPGLQLSTQRIVAIVLVVFVLVLVAPPVWARLEPIFTNWFSFQSPDGENFTAIGGFDAFTPYHAGYLPEGFESSLLGTLTGQGIDSVEIGYDEREGGFITLVQSMGTAVTGLPNGEVTRVGSNEAIFIRSFATSAEEMRASRPEISIVSNYDYSEVNYLAWFLGDIKVEIFSSLPLAELVKVGESLVPMQASVGESPLP